MEILLSLGLMMIVLLAALAGMVLLQKIMVAGRARAGQAQLARAIERRMRADIRCVLFQEQEPAVEEEEEPTSTQYATVNENVGAADDAGGTTTAPTATGASGSTNSSSTTSSSTSSTSTATSATTPAGAYTSQSMGVFGNASTLVLHVSKPSREAARSLGTLAGSAMTGTSGTMSTTGPISQLSDLRSISYFLAVAGGGGLQGAVGNTAAGGSAVFATEQGAQGLARLEGNRLKIQQADAAGNLDLLAQQAEVLAPEVTELTFRYFNGQAWVTTWDSVTLNALPRAIEVTMRIGQQPSAESSAPLSEKPLENSTAAPSLVYRFVVALPLSDRTLGLMPAGGL